MIQINGKNRNWGRHKVSFCVVCMNRTYHLKETLVNNIINNDNYPDLEIILLDYNSRDEMEQWAKENLKTYIDSGKLTYYKTFQPAVFNHSHSKNLAFKLASGDLVCNVNADSFTGPGFADYINYAFQKNESIFLAPSRHLESDLGISGTICLSRKDFFTIGGFDEKMVIYGWEDADIGHRLRLAGIERVTMLERQFLRCIEHDNRYDVKKLSSEFHSVYISHLDHTDRFCARVLILFNDHTFKSGTIVDNLRKAAKTGRYKQVVETIDSLWFQYELEEYNWFEGRWEQDDGSLKLFDTSGNMVKHYNKVVHEQKEALNDGGPDIPYYLVTDLDLIFEITHFELDYRNRLIMLDNLINKKAVVNNGNFGQAVVYKNFNYDAAIEIN